MMMRTVLLIAAGIGFGAGAALAQDQGQASMKSGNIYAGVMAGVVMPEDVSFSSNASQGGTTVTASGKFEYQPGYSASAYMGYRFNPYLRGEVEGAYARFDYDKISGNFTLTQGTTNVTVSGSADLEGEVQSWLGLARGVVSPLGKSKIQPLLGGGVGFARHEEKITSIGGTAVSAKADGTDLALEGMAGLEAEVSSSIDLGIRYRYLWIDSGDKGFDDSTAHNVVGSVSYRF
jgi:opacity protein-like surface antigen